VWATLTAVLDKTTSQNDPERKMKFNLRGGGALKCAGAEAQSVFASDGTAKAEP